MILSGDEIKRQIEMGYISISDFDESRLNPNSYNLRLSDELLLYKCGTLDMAEDNPTERFTIPEDGFVLFPGRLYLASTMERTATDCFVPMLEGRSSVGRLGLFIHVTAGFGDIGFDGRWTLELTVVEPLIIYPGAEICQIYFHTVQGSTERKYKRGKYSGANEVQASRMWEEFR